MKRRKRRRGEPTLWDECMRVYYPRVYKTTHDGYVQYAVDFYSSDFQMTPSGLDRVRGFLLKYLPEMRAQELRGPSLDFIHFVIAEDAADYVIAGLRALLRDAGNVRQLPVTPREISKHFDAICEAEKRIQRAHKKMLSDPVDVKRLPFTIRELEHYHDEGVQCHKTLRVSKESKHPYTSVSVDLSKPDSVTIFSSNIRNSDSNIRSFEYGR